MQLKRARLYTRIPQRSELLVWDELRPDFSGVLNDVKSSFWKQFGLDFLDESGDARPGDIFWAEGDVLLYYYVAPTRDFVEAGCLLTRNDGNQVYQGFCERIHDGLGVGKNVQWKTYTDVSPTYQVLHEEARRLEPAEDELSSATLLSDAAHRDLLRKMSLQGSSFLEALAVGRDLLEVGTLVANLEQHHLLQREYVVVCKKTGHQISRVRNLDEIEAVSRSGFKCPHCGSSYNEERVDQLVACTSVGERMARPNYWLALASLKVMERLHMPMTQVLHLNERDFEVLDLFVPREGAMLMLEPHDKPIRLNDAFMFCARARYYRPQVAVLVSAVKTSAEVERYLRQNTGGDGDATRILLVHGTHDLEEQLSTVLLDWQANTLRSTLERFQSGTRLDIGSLVSLYFFGPDADMPRSPVQEPVKEEEDTSLPATSGDYEEELHRPIEETMDAEPPAEPEPVTEPPAPQSTATPVAEQPGHRSTPEPIEDVADFDDVGTYGAEFYVTEESIPPETTQEDLRDQAIKRLVEDVHAHGVAGRVPSIEKAIKDGNISATLVSDEGLSLAANLDPVLEGDLVAALAVDVNDVIARGLAEAEFPAATMMTARAVPLNFSFHPLDGSLLLVHERRVAEPVEEEPFHMHSEMDLRDAILKRVLDDLSRQDGVQSNIVVNREGLVIDHQALPQFEDAVHMWAAVLSQALIDAERSLHRMQAVPLKQLLIWTPQVLISLIPLDREGILVSTLSPTAPKDTYGARLLKAGTMLTSVFL